MASATEEHGRTFRGARVILALAVLAAWQASAGAATKATGKITGKIANPKRCTGVGVVTRGGTKTRLKVTATRGKYDATTGEFEIAGLKDGLYDLRVYVKGGHIDGCDLKMDPSQESDKPMTKKDREKIMKYVEDFPERFCDILRPMYLEGNHEFAKMLVEKIRYRPFHSGTPGERLWRVEIWVFQNYYGGWRKKQHGWQVLARERATRRTPEEREKFDNMMWLFDPKIGGIEVEDGETTVVKDYTVPEKFDMSMGKVPGSVEKQAEKHKKTKGGPAAY